MKAKFIWTLIVLAMTLSGPAPSVAPAASLPGAGEWDGATASAHLETPYEDPLQSDVPFGAISYYLQPWRSYMDTWSASQYEGCFGANWNIDPKYADAVGQILKESGVRTVRIEIGWGNLDWNDSLPDGYKQKMRPLFDMCRKYGIRPLILLNAHHGQPCPVRTVTVDLVANAKKGDTVLKLASGTRVSEDYTGLGGDVAAYPLITKVDIDGSAHLSAALRGDVKAGNLNLIELKYQPFQGDHLADGTPVPACQETFDGWVKYVAAVAAFAREAMQIKGAHDAGFDLEVWNEQTFGSNFLNVANYYDAPPKYKTYQNNWTYVYSRTRAMLATYRPGAQTQFAAGDRYAILPMTIDYIRDHQSDYPGVKVISGFANQWPWDSGTGLWPGQTGFSRHYYAGGWTDISPKQAPNVHTDGEVSGTIDALGAPGSVFVPSFRLGYPEYYHSGFKTESLSRDVLPDSRYSYFSGHGRYTNNGDFQAAELWESEVNYWRSQFFSESIFKDGSIKRDDPRAIALDEHLNAKLMLRQYIFHNHKGLKRLYLYCLGPDPYSFGMLPERFYDALDKSNGVLTPEVRALIPQGYPGLAWLARQMDAAEAIAAPRALKVSDLVEYKPRLVWAGDGSAAHPNRWNRDWFTFLPYQLSPSKFLIPYYVQTTDMNHAWDRTKGVLDPARWDMPPQDYDVTIANVRGNGARVSVYDPITLTDIPVTVTNATSNSLTVHLTTVDYPRFLTVTETAPGPQILDPKLELTAGNHVRISWKTNVPSGISLTYGADWENRSAQEADLPAGSTSYTVPDVIKGVVAVRIKAVANGLRDIWPRWDEDPQGQIVVPGGEITTPATTALAWSAQPKTTTVPIVSLAKGALPSLQVRYDDPLSHWSVGLPSGVTPINNGATMEVALPTSSGVAILRMRYLRDAAVNPESQLPYTSSIDETNATPVTLPAGLSGTFYDYTLAGSAHPGMTNLRQSFLLVPAGNSGKDLFVLSATGTAVEMSGCRNVILAIVASVSPGH